MTLVSSQIFAALYGPLYAYLSRVMDDGKTSEPPPKLSRKDQVRANLINLTRLNFSPLKLLHYFSIIPHSPVRTRGPPILSTSSFQTTSFINNDTRFPILLAPPNVNSIVRIYGFIHRPTSKLELAMLARYRRPNPR